MINLARGGTQRRKEGGKGKEEKEKKHQINDVHMRAAHCALRTVESLESAQRLRTADRKHQHKTAACADVLTLRSGRREEESTTPDPALSQCLSGTFGEAGSSDGVQRRRAAGSDSVQVTACK